MRDNIPAVAGSGSLIGILGGLIGLGGAEFRLPLLIGLFRFQALDAVILNKTMSLVVVVSALPFRVGTVPFADVMAQWPVILNLLAGSLAGAWVGAGVAMRLNRVMLHRVIALLLILIAAALLFGHGHAQSSPWLTGPALLVAGIIAGFGIGIVASLLGVAGGELLIPTLVLLFGVDVKLAGSLSLVVSLPTMLVGFSRYLDGRGIRLIRANVRFVTIMALASIVGTFVGGQLLGIVPTAVLLPLLAVILVVSSIKVWFHAK